MSKRDIHKLEVKSDPEDPAVLERVDSFAEKITSKLDFTDDDKDNIAISVSEAVNNAIIHGNQGDPAKKVKITFETTEEGLFIEVLDEGKGFNVNEIPDPTDPENLLSESGRGILIIRHLMDEANIVQVNDGTKVVMKKLFSKSEI